MPATSDAIRAFFSRIRQTMNEQEAAERFAGKVSSPSKPRIRPSRIVGAASLNSAWRTLRQETITSDEDQAALADTVTVDGIAAYSHNIENMIGTVKFQSG